MQRGVFLLSRNESDQTRGTWTLKPISPPRRTGEWTDSEKDSQKAGRWPAELPGGSMWEFCQQDGLATRCGYWGRQNVGCRPALGVTGPLSVTLCAHWSGHWAENQSEAPGYGRTKVLTIDQAGSQHQEWNRTQCKPSLGFSHRWIFIPELPGRAQVAPAVESHGQGAWAGCLGRSGHAPGWVNRHRLKRFYQRIPGNRKRYTYKGQGELSS